MSMNKKIKIFNRRANAQARQANNLSQDPNQVHPTSPSISHFNLNSQHQIQMERLCFYFCHSTPALIASPGLALAMASRPLASAEVHCLFIHCHRHWHCNGFAMVKRRACTHFHCTAAFIQSYKRHLARSKAINPNLKPL